MAIFYNTRQTALFDDFKPQNNAVKITKNLGGIDIQTPFSRTFVDELKARVPFQYRTWDNNLKVWRVAFQFAEAACELVEETYGFCPDVDLTGDSEVFQNQTYLIEYVGACKIRGENGESMAMGFSQNNWNIILPEKVLREFFEGKTEENEPDQPSLIEPKRLTYYQLLGVKKAVEQALIKTAYRRMAKQWHPDVCREPNAHDRFEAINAAYQVLSIPMMRKRYDAGLAFEQEAKKVSRWSSPKTQNNGKLYINGISAAYGYISPLRCGIVTLDGEYGIGKIIVSKIHKWEDWVENGKTAVVSWNMITMKINTIWI
jgi:DnaJ domain